MLRKLLDLLNTGHSAPTEIPDSLWQAVLSRHPFLAVLPPADQQELRQMTQRFLADKVFSGAHAYEPDNLARVSIAAQACLLVLKLDLAAYAGWSGIVVYPEEFVIPRREIDEDGVLHEYEEDALGEAWPGGPVILTWFEDAQAYDGANVVIHEFAHKLDLLNGEADGMPPLHAGMSQDEWEAALLSAFEHFSARVEAGEETWLDPYAAEHPAEFFAVASEAFFTDALALHTDYPDFYTTPLLEHTMYF